MSLMMSRLTAVNERIKATRTLPNQDRDAVGSSMALDSFKRRGRLLSDGIILSLGGGMCATLLLAALFASQFFGLHHVYGAGVLFFVATLLLGIALFMARASRNGGIAIKSFPRCISAFEPKRTFRKDLLSIGVFRTITISTLERAPAHVRANTLDTDK
jgi:hypothetical protein